MLSNGYNGYACDVSPRLLKQFYDIYYTPDTSFLPFLFAFYQWLILYFRYFDGIGNYHAFYIVTFTLYIARRKKLLMFVMHGFAGIAYVRSKVCFVF